MKLSPVRLFAPRFQVVTAGDYQRVILFHAGISSADAYNITQSNDEIRHADILVLPNENIIGVMVKAWPVAVSERTGEFHRMHEDGIALPQDEITGRAFRLARDIAANGFEIV